MNLSDTLDDPTIRAVTQWLIAIITVTLFLMPALVVGSKFLQLDASKNLGKSAEF